MHASGKRWIYQKEIDMETLARTTNMIDPLSEFVQNGRKEKDRASVDILVEDGDCGFHLRAKGGKKALEKLIGTLTKKALE
jgi:hypothetical protein